MVMQADLRAGAGLQRRPEAGVTPGGRLVAGRLLSELGQGGQQAQEGGLIRLLNEVDVL